MKVIKAYPPNYTKIRAAFPHIAGRTTVIYAYGDRVYCPSGNKLPDSLLAHEAVHGERQGSDPDGWWAQYMSDGEFRLNEEVLAHRAEYRFLKRAGAKDTDYVARRLCSPLYGASLTLDRARELIAA